MFRFICVLIFGVQPVFSQTIELERGALDETFPIERGGTEILFSTFSGRAVPAWTVPCQQFTDGSLGGFTVFVADDFQIWNLSTVNRVNVFGTYFNGSGPADSINIYIFANDAMANMPNTLDPSMAVYSQEALPYTDRNFGDFTIDLPGSGAILPPGRYWLCVQPVMAAGVGGQWGWTESSYVPDTGMTFDFESVFYQTQAILPPSSCVNEWGRRVSVCGFSRPAIQACEEFDMAFSLEGSDISLINTTPSDNLEVSEMGPSAMISVVLATAPSSSVTLDIHSSDETEAKLVGPSINVPISLIFTTENWNITQFVEVKGVNDALADGDAPFRVIFDPAVSADPNFSGFKVRDIEGINREDACVANELTDITTSNSSKPAFSGGGQILAFQSNGDFIGNNSDGNVEIFIYNRNTDSFSQITQTTSGVSSAPDLDLSGNSLVFQSTAVITGGSRGSVSEIYHYDINSDLFTRITDSTGAANGSHSPDISEDGTMIAFISDADFTGENPDGSREAFLFNGVEIIQISDDAGDDPSAHVDHVAIDGSGSKVIYTKNLTERPLFLYESIGRGGPVQLASGLVSDPAISSNGTRVSFTSNGDYTGGNPDASVELFLYDFTIENGSPISQVTDGSPVLTSSMNESGERVAFVTTDDLTGDNPGNYETLFSLDLARNVLIQIRKDYGPGSYDGLSYKEDYLAYGADDGCYTTGSKMVGYVWLSAFEDQLSLWPTTLTVADFLDDICD